MKSTSIGRRLHEARKKLGISAHELSVKAGLAGGTVNHIERGYVREPKTLTLVNLSKILNVSIEWLITGRSDDSSNVTPANPLTEGH